MSTAEPWQNLQEKYLAALDCSPPAARHEIWRLFLEDEWFQAELTGHARIVLRSNGGTDQWLDDVRHEVLLQLAARLCKAADLGLDRLALETKFPHSVGTLVHNECRHAVRRISRIYQTADEPLTNDEQSEDLDSRQKQEQLLDVGEAIDELPAILRPIMQLSLLGYSIQEIALRLGLKYKQALRAFHRAIEQIRSDLA